jgi:hypothetical protein
MDNEMREDEELERQYDAELQDDEDWRTRVHDDWIEADRLAEAQVRAAEHGYLGGRGR